MKRVFYRNILMAIFFSSACDSLSPSWNKIYNEQQSLFNTNQQSFGLAAHFLDSSFRTDTTLFISDDYFQLPDSLVTDLQNAGISQVSVYNKKCKNKIIKFIPDSLWYIDRFSVVEIIYNSCDERSRKGYHWKLKGSQHKHSFGQGNGWFIYSDSDPF